MCKYFCKVLFCVSCAQTFLPSSCFAGKAASPGARPASSRAVLLRGLKAKRGAEVRVVLCCWQPAVHSSSRSHGFGWWGLGVPGWDGTSQRGAFDACGVRGEEVTWLNFERGFK